MSELHFEAASCDSLNIEIVSAEGTEVEIKYSVPNHGNPKAGQHYIAIWQTDGSGEIPWGQKPIKTALVDKEQESSTACLDGLELSDHYYVVGYSPVPEVIVPEGKSQNFCASAFISQLPLDQKESGDDCRCISMSLKKVSTESVDIEYAALAQFNPELNGNWIGIWDNASNFSTPPLRHALVKGVACSGHIRFTDFPVVCGKKYRIGYFMGGYSEDKTNLHITSLAAVIRFSAKD